MRLYCSHCKKNKETFYFSKASTTRGFQYTCKKCKKIYWQKYYKNNKSSLYTNRPKWYNSYYKPKSRCENPNNAYYHRYGGRGIVFKLTWDNIEFLWARDNAQHMKDPTLDRIDNDGHYTLENCQFLERAENARKANNKPILQYDLKGNLIKEWESTKSASDSLQICDSSISRNLNNVYKKAGNYIFKYKENQNAKS